MEIIAFTALVLAFGAGWWLIDRWRGTRTRLDDSADARASRKARVARKELIRRFPDRDPDARVPVVKRIGDLEAGELVRIRVDAHHRVHFLGPGPSDGGPDAPGGASPEFAVFTGFTESGRRRLVGICDLDGYGTRTLDLPLDDEVVAYVEG